MAKKGAPLQIMLGEGVGRIGGTVTIVRRAPHPNAGAALGRAGSSAKRQRAFAQAGETPAHPNIEPMEKILPAKTYMLTADDTQEFPKYQKLWNEIFQLR